MYRKAVPLLLHFIVISCNERDPKERSGLSLAAKPLTIYKAGNNNHFPRLNKKNNVTYITPQKNP